MSNNNNQLVRCPRCRRVIPEYDILNHTCVPAVQHEQAPIYSLHDIHSMNSNAPIYDTNSTRRGRGKNDTSEYYYASFDDNNQLSLRQM